MEPYQERVIEEKTDLDLRINRLFIFLNTTKTSSKLSEAEFGRMKKQLDFMIEYSNILQERIVNFENNI